MERKDKHNQIEWFILSTTSSKLKLKMAINGTDNYKQMENTKESDEDKVEQLLEKLHDQPFHRRTRESTKFNESNMKHSLLHSLKALNCAIDGTADMEQIVGLGLEVLAQTWRRRDADSEIAFQGLLAILEYCLYRSAAGYSSFEQFINALGYNAVQFWRYAVPYIYDSDLTYGTKFRDSLLFSLTLFDINNGKSKLRELYSSMPGVRKSLLGVHAKRFGEQFHHLQRRLSISREGSSFSSMINSTESISSRSSEKSYISVATNRSRSVSRDKPRRLRRSISRGASESSVNSRELSKEVIASGGLASTHFQQRVINVSNAPPVSLTREKTGEWEIKQGSGGLVSAVDPVMSKDKENVWLANLGMNLHKKPKRSRDHGHQNIQPTTNTLGLPLLKQANADVLFHVLTDEPKDSKEQDTQHVREEMSLLGVLHNYNRGNYKLNPVIVQEDDYNVYYGGISNGLLWPALHNLEEYIVKEYDEAKIMREHWYAYVRVNYQFAIDAVRNSRPQDFIWIHDYHLLLTGMIMQSLDENLEVGFQTHRDRDKLIELCRIQLPTAEINYESSTDVCFVTYKGWTCSLGVFPVSIKNEDFLKFVRLTETCQKAAEIRKRVMGTNAPPDGRLFFSVERFDYTKGIKEKLLAYKNYFQKYPERIGKDVLYQIAVTNRRAVDTYRVYQDECILLAEGINKVCTCANRPDWKPLIFQTEGLPRKELIACYLAMDIGVVTPKKDGMNLVAKEMLLCNPNAGLILSSGAGSEVQFSRAGFYQENGDQCYKRISNLYDLENYSDAFYQAAIQDLADRRANGFRLHNFIISHDIEKWSTAFLDPSWTHEVIRPIEVKTLEDFYTIMLQTRNVRRQIVERVLKGIPVRSHFAISLKNALDSLKRSCKANTTVVNLRTTSEESAVDYTSFDIKNELDEFEKDLCFLKFIASDNVYNVEQFVDTLHAYHPKSSTAFKEEVAAAVGLLYDADHFQYFFTDRDGTLKSYSCSYQASIQPAYAAVIQAQFARRCAQTCAIITTSPLMSVGILDVSTMPEGYYYYGASAGREWFIDPRNKFRDLNVTAEQLQLLDKVYDNMQELLNTQEYKYFKCIGSGLQKHYGHITIAYQDIHNSVPAEQSKALLKKINEIVDEIDGMRRTLVINEGSTDIKIFLKNSDGIVFNKGHGIALMVENIRCKLSDGNILVCGDSESDLPMVEVCLGRNPRNVYTIWVTERQDLKAKVMSLCKRYGNRNVAFVSCPEVLLGAMAQATIREISIVRPRNKIPHKSI
uniref:alpha,alpha-trehalose-phosphate synthase (UDP-forming) n=1 Tax=Elaeophora elaphi TaxID=1147741 RepID=A0A0R3RPV4_9BILA